MTPSERLYDRACTFILALDEDTPQELIETMARMLLEETSGPTFAHSFAAAVGMWLLGCDNGDEVDMYLFKDPNAINPDSYINEDGVLPWD